MIGILTKVFIIALALVLTAEFLPGVSIEGAYPALIAAAVLGLLNAIVRPILVVLTLPITIVSLGLFIFVINAGLFMVAAKFVHNFDVVNFWWALAGSLCVTVISTILNKFIS